MGKTEDLGQNATSDQGGPRGLLKRGVEVRLRRCNPHQPPDPPHEHPATVFPALINSNAESSVLVKIVNRSR